MTNEQSSLSSVEAILAETRFFGDLSPAQMSRVAALAVAQERNEGDPVYRTGERAVDMYVLVHGLVRMVVGYGDRNTHAGDVLRRGEVFGWAALTPECNMRVATASCLSSCSLLAINGERLLALMEQDHTIGYRLATQLTRLITGTLSAFAGG